MLPFFTHFWSYRFWVTWISARRLGEAQTFVRHAQKFVHFFLSLTQETRLSGLFCEVGECFSKKKLNGFMPKAKSFHNGNRVCDSTSTPPFEVPGMKLAILFESAIGIRKPQSHRCLWNQGRASRRTMLGPPSVRGSVRHR